MNDNYNHYLHKYNVFDHDFILNTLDKIPPIGFRSVYAVRKETAEEIKKTGFKGYKGEVWAPVLSVDVDNYGHGQEVARQLKTLGIGFRMWDSGSKGIHFEIDRIAPASKHLPFWDKRWVERNIENADTSIYTHLHLFRLPGTRHRETGRKKTLLETFQGKAIQYEQADLTPPTFNNVTVVGTNDRSIFDDFMIKICSAPQENGKRHQALMTIATILRYNFNEPRTFTERYLHHVNLLFREPKTQEELRRIVDHFYGGTPLQEVPDVPSEDI